MMGNSVRTIESMRLRASRKMGLATTKGIAAVMESLVVKHDVFAQDAISPPRTK
jgi:hypothetical protein